MKVTAMYREGLGVTLVCSMCFYLLVNIFYKVLNRKNKSPQNPHFHPILGSVTHMVAIFHKLHGNDIYMVLIGLDNMRNFVNIDKSNVFMLIFIEITFYLMMRLN